MPLELVKENPAQKAAREVLERAAGPVAASEVLSFDSEGRRVIRHLAGRLPEIADVVLNALVISDAGVFASASGLVRVYPAREAKNSSVTRPKGALTLHGVDSTHLAEIAGRVAIHEKYDGRAKDWVPCDCPRRVAETILARGQWDALDYLNGFIEAPTITPAGRVVEQPGYDTETGLILAIS
jgi:putative DNA primase/helicase